MAGSPQPPRDAKGEYRRKCRKLADDLGYEREAVWYWFEQIAAAREKESQFNRDRTVAEDAAFRDVIVALDKRGCSEPS
jgi:hypothetical protein